MTSSSAAMTAAKPKTSPWMASLYGGLFTGIIFAVFTLLLQTSMPVLWGLCFLLVGAGPVLGYQLAAGRLGSDWRTIIGGIVGNIIPGLGWVIVWPLFVWLFHTKANSFLRLWLGSLIGAILGLVVFFAIGLLMGQDPIWFGPGMSVLWGIWGGAAAAFQTGRE